MSRLIDPRSGEFLSWGPDYTGAGEVVSVDRVEDTDEGLLVHGTLPEALADEAQERFAREVITGDGTGQPVGIQVEGKVYPAHVDADGDLLVQPAELGVTEAPAYRVRLDVANLERAIAAVSDQPTADNVDYDKTAGQARRGLDRSRIDAVRSIPPVDQGALRLKLIDRRGEDEPSYTMPNRAERRRQAKRARRG